MTRSKQRRGADVDPREDHLAALARIGAFTDKLKARASRLQAREARRPMRGHPGAGLPGDMQDPDSPAPRRYPAEEADAAERAAGRKLRAAYWPLLGETPQLAPADHAGAWIFVTKIRTAIERGGWTRNEWTTLYELERKWRARAEGRDPRFETAGTRPGRLKKPQEQQVRIARERARQAERLSRG